MLNEGHRMSEEFKPIRITLSEEAFDRLEKIMKGATFRNYSSTVEECIRVVFDIIGEIYTVQGGQEKATVDPNAAWMAYIRIATRMSRFTGLTIVIPPSAGP